MREITMADLRQLTVVQDESLEGKLRDVKMGDIILLESPKVTVAGYVNRKTDNYVTLSYADPNSTITLSQLSTDYLATDFTRNIRDRNYFLRKFKSCQIIRRVSETQEEAEGLVERRTTGAMRSEHKNIDLDTVKIGEILLLYTKGLAIAGFVSRKYSDKVELSHIDPNSELQGTMLAGQSYSDGPFRTCERPFYFTKFDGYKILKKIRTDE